MSKPATALVLHTESSRGLGGQEIRILTESRWLIDHGWRALVAAQPASPLVAEAPGAGVPAVTVPMPGAVDPRAVLRLRRLMRREGVALVHTHSSVDSWLATLAARSLGLPVVRSRHVTIPIRRRRALVYRLADRVITSGEGVAALVRAAGVPAERVVAIAPGIDPRRFHPGVSGVRLREELGLAAETKVAGLVANVRGSKGHEFFLEAARTVLAEEPRARFLIVGGGIGFADVQRRVHEMGLTAAVIMTGFRRDIPEVMAALDVLTLPSVRSEAFSQVLPQALAVGRPVIATTVGGSPEIVHDGETGLLVPPADPGALARAMLALFRDPALAARLARAGQALVLGHHTIDAAMTRTTAVYRELLARRGTPRNA